jgi:CHAT domain-containing protein
LRGLEILRKKFGAEHYRIARMLGNLAILYQMQADYVRAEPLFRQTVEMMEKTVGKEHQDYAAAIYSLAKCYTDRGDYEKAEPLYRKALEIAEKLFAAPHPDVISYLNSLARNFQAKGNTKQSLDLLSRSHLLSERNAQAILFTSSENQKLLYLNSLSGETNQYHSAHLKFAPNDAAALELALTTIFERKGRVSDAVAFEFSALRNRFGTDDRILLDNLKKITSQLAQKILNGAENTTAENHQKQIKELEEQKERLEQEISRKSSEFSSRIQPATISSIRATIPENAALIEFAIYRPFNPQAVGDDEKRAFGEPRYAAYVVRRQGEIQWKDLGTAKTIDDSIENLRQALRDVKRKDVKQLARVLDEKIMSPLRTFFGDAKHLLISPDGNLSLIPFEALVNEKNQFAVENYSFTYLTGGRDLLKMQTARTNKSNPLIIANPLFGISENVTATRNLSDTFFAPLGGTLQEARSIQTIFSNATFLSGAQATETALKQTNAPQILHLATHGFFLEDKKIDNPLLRSGLAFAGANSRKGEKDDGILTALEASGLNLWGTKLVVLSACDTGLGEVRNGEGVYGLRRAFVLAGTESLVMSLWSISDYVTRELMTNYYKNLKNGLGRGASLRQVQLEMLKKPNRQHPFYWASFIQSGDWTVLQIKN